ncbi:MAG: AarF/ABC1/UbiB kinase family protein [Anaerolineae bacterium]|nr:AarF/ABC1/UbiB kinase family protein [Anaerolineae bacterium]
MYAWPWGRRVRNLRRYREVLRVFLRHGFDNAIQQLGLGPLISLPRRTLGRGREEMPPPTMAQHFRLALEELGPTFVKLGQVLSTRPDLLPPEFITELSKLQDQVPPFPFAQARAQVEDSLGKPLEAIFAEFSEEPLAAASLGQVHAARLKDGTEVVVKVQRPDIEEIISVDLDILYDVAQLAEERTPLGELYPLREMAEDFAATLRAEMDYRREGRNADRFRENFRGVETVYIPRVYWAYTTGRVLTLERLRGIRIDDLEGMREAGIDPKRVALHSTQLVLKEVFEDGFFHADPHAGNFFVLPGEVIGAMDFGMVGRLDRETKESLLRLFIAAVQFNVASLVEELDRMGVIGPGVDRAWLRRDLARILDRFYGVPLSEMRVQPVMESVLPVAFRHRLRLPSNLWLLGKSLVMMEGLGQRLYPDMDVFAVARPYVQESLRQMASPSAVARRTVEWAQDWAGLLASIPEKVPQLLDQAQRGEMELGIRIDGLDEVLARLDRLVNRLGTAILIAAFILGLAWLIPPFYPGGWRQWGVVIPLAGFALASFLGLWWAWVYWRSGRGRRR